MTERSEKDKQALQTYFNSIKEKTGLTVEQFRPLVKAQGFTKVGEVIAWLKAEYKLGHGHANLVAQMALQPEVFKEPAEVKHDKLFAGKKAVWREPYEALLIKLAPFGAEFVAAANNSYINLKRGDKKFGIVQPAAAERMDIGIKLKGVAPTARLEAAGSWNEMVTHRVRITDAGQIDDELIAWLKQAYDLA